MYGTGVLLLSAVAGYWVLERSATQGKKDVKRVGKVVGWVVVVTSLLGVACQVYAVASKSGMCPAKPWCPFSPTTAGPASPAK